MRGKRGQGDIHKQREIITMLCKQENTKLCVIIEPCGRYSLQDDTAVDLALDFQKVNLIERFGNIQEWPQNVIGEIIMPIAEEVFQMEGLIVIDCRFSKYLADEIMMVFKSYYFNHVEDNSHNKTHLIYVLPSEAGK